LAEQRRNGFPLGMTSEQRLASPGDAAPSETTTAAAGFPGMVAAAPAFGPSAPLAAPAPARTQAPRTQAPRAQAPAVETPAVPAPRPDPAPSSATGRRRNGDTLWERVRFEVTDVVTSGSLSERLIRASAAVEAPITTGRRIVVVGTAGGAGTSTVTAVMAKLFGSLRQETVMALDSTDHSGRLLRYLGAPAPAPMSALMHQLRTLPVRTLPDATAGAVPCGNQIFAADRQDVPTLADSPIGVAEWTDVSSTLSRFMAVTVVDAGHSPLSRHTAALLATAHAVVLVTPPGEADAALLGKIRTELADSFPAAQQLGVTVRSRQAGASAADGLPYDRHLAPGGALQLSRLGSRTRIAATELAGRALLAANRS